MKMMRTISASLDQRRAHVRMIAVDHEEAIEHISGRRVDVNKEKKRVKKRENHKN